MDIMIKSGDGDISEAIQFSTTIGALVDRDRVAIARQWERQLREPWVREHIAAVSMLIDMDIQELTDEVETSGLALMPILYHEIGHLSRGTSSSFLDWIEEIVAALAQPTMLAREREADVYAVELMGKSSATLISGSSNSMFSAQSVIATVKLMRDVVLADMFDGFRGLAPEDHLFLIDHVPCDLDAPKLIPRFGHIDGVRYAERAPFPLVTADEFGKMRGNAIQRSRHGSHPHHFERGLEYLRALAAHELVPDEFVNGLLAERLDTLHALIENEPLKLAPAPLPATGIRLDDLLYSLEEYLVLEPAVNCEPNRCFVGRFVPGASGFGGSLGGFAEIMLEGDRVTFAEFVLPLFGRDWEAGDPTGFNALNPETYIAQSAVFSRILKNMTGDPGRVEDGTISDAALNAIIALRHGALACGASTYVYDAGSHLIEGRTINEDHWISLIARAPS
jgi:hypothetical protein